jgi:hypothetical protein
MIDPSMHSHIPAGSPQGVPSFARTYGLHPFVAFMMFAIDQMLFVILELPSLEVLATVSFMVGCALVPICTLIQRYAYGDSWGAAIGKGMGVGLLTAIPTSLPSALTVGWGVLGIIGMRGGPRPSEGRVVDMRP